MDVYLSAFFVYHNTPTKNPRLDLKNSENYRAIALSSVFGKIVIEKQVEQLGTLELQFCYKTKSSTLMCSTGLTKTIEYYVSRKTPVYALLIDASKAFDCVSHIKLFNTLQAHGVCPLIIQVLYNMYTNSDMQVRWKSELSNVFPLMNGVKQGGCLSPMLFTMYLDGTIQKVKHVVPLPRPMEGNGVTQIFRSLQNCQFHHKRLESLEHF